MSLADTQRELIPLMPAGTGIAPCLRRHALELAPWNVGMAKNRKQIEGHIKARPKP